MKSFLSKDTILELLSSSVLSNEQIDRDFIHLVKLTNRDNLNITETADKLDFIVTQARSTIDTSTNHHTCPDISMDISDIKNAINSLNQRIGGFHLQLTVAQIPTPY